MENWHTASLLVMFDKTDRLHHACICIHNSIHQSERHIYSIYSKTVIVTSTATFMQYRMKCNSEHTQNALRQHAQTVDMLDIEWNGKTILPATTTTKSNIQTLVINTVDSRYKEHWYNKIPI